PCPATAALCDASAGHGEGGPQRPSVAPAGPDFHHQRRAARLHDNGVRPGSRPQTSQAGHRGTRLQRCVTYPPSTAAAARARATDSMVLPVPGGPTPARVTGDALAGHDGVRLGQPGAGAIPFQTPHTPVRVAAGSADQQQWMANATPSLFAPTAQTLRAEVAATPSRKTLLAWLGLSTFAHLRPSPCRISGWNPEPSKKSPTAHALLADVAATPNSSL